MTDVAGKLVVASVSGGKDSTAMSLWLTEQGIEHRRVHMLTGWDHPVTLDYLRGDLARALGHIEEIRGDLLMPELVRKKAMFPSRTRRFCTEELKVKPIIAYVRANSIEVSAVGIRAAESAERARLPEWEWNEDFDCFVWRPLIAWSEQDVIDIHARHGLRPNPLYLKGAERVGCWPCIFARKSEIRLLADVDPGRIDELRALEAELTASARARAEAKGEGLRHPRTWFQGHEKGAVLPIDEAVAWSRTSHGGKQVELFAPPREGCMRWGLCDTGGEEP